MNFKFIVLFIVQFILMEPVYAQSPPIIKIEFTSLARGFHKSISITNDSVMQAQQGLADPHEITLRRKLKAKEWDRVLRSLAAISLPDVPALKAPTQGSHADAARQSTLTITTRGGQSVAHTFDNENPNERLRPLILAIRKVSAVK